jgi:broad specificity phosphatase PhoE
MYESLSKMSAKITTSALSAGLTLNNNGRTFAAQLTAFLLRRTAAGRLRPCIGRGAAQNAAEDGAAAGGGGAGGAPDAPSGASLPAKRVGASVRGSVVYRHPAPQQAKGATPITEWGSGSGTTAAARAGGVGAGAGGAAGGVSSASVMSRAHTMPHALDSMVGPAALLDGSPGAGGETAGSRSNGPPLRRVVSEATLVAEEPPRPLRVALRESSLGGSTTLLPPPSSGSRRSSPEAAFGRPPGAVDGGQLLLRGRSSSAPTTPAPDSDEHDGIVASAPLLAQNDHYKRSAASAPDAAAGAGAAFSGGDDAEEAGENAPPQPLAVYEAEPAIYTSTLPRTIDMVGALPFPSQQLSALNPMDTGICLGIPMQYMGTNFPDEFRMWMEAPDRARYRIPGGESLMDVVERLTPFVIEIERQKRPVVVVSHLSTLQVLLAYFKGVPLQECIDLECPMNTVVRRTGSAERVCCLRPLVSATHLRQRHAAGELARAY